MKDGEATAWAPASLSNLGPGFDALGAALTDKGDAVTVRTQPDDGITVSFDPDGKWVGPTDPDRNTAAVSAAHVARGLGYDGGLSVRIRKGLAAGTGLGSSAASAVAAAVATERLLGGDLSQEAMMDAVVAGESATSGQGHADNVLPSLLGGFVLMRSRSPVDHLRVIGWDSLRLVVVLPEAEVLTRDARKALPGMISLSDAVDHAARLALMVGSMERRDIGGLGRWMMSDDIIIPSRRFLWPYLDPVVEAALEAGAAGCTVSGSGPALVACCDASMDPEMPERIRMAMLRRLEETGMEATGSIHAVNNDGALLLTGEEAVSWRTGRAAPYPTI